MRFLHISDLHLGKVIHGVSMMAEDQPDWIDRFLELTEALRPEAVVISGDVYDRGSPAGEAVAYELPRRVLVVDDSPVNRAVLKAMLGKLGVAEVELAADGAAALGRLERDPDFDWVLTDMWMPVLDGAGLVRRIRADARLAGLRVCSVTADVEARGVHRGQGFDALLLKPVTVESLRGLFARGKTP